MMYVNYLETISWSNSDLPRGNWKLDIGWIFLEKGNCKDTQPQKFSGVPHGTSDEVYPWRLFASEKVGHSAEKK